MEKSSARYMIALAIVALLAIYILSIGPVMRLADRGYIAPDTFEAMYAPLGPLVRLPGVRHALFDYLDWWEPHETSA